MKAYVINLDKDRGRWTSAQRVLEPLGLEVQRVSAVDGSQLPRNPFLSAGEVGCFHSHVLALETFLASRDAQGVVFEDDIASDLTLEEFQKHMALASHYLENVDILYLGKCFCECGTFELIEENLYSTSGALCLHAYMVSRAGAKKLLRTLGNKHHAIDPIDLIYYNKGVLGVLKCAAFHPSLFKQDASHVSNLRTTRSVQRAIDSECAKRSDLVPWHTALRRARGYVRVYWWVGVLVLIIMLFWWKSE